MSLHLMGTFLSKTFSLSFISQDSLIQILVMSSLLWDHQGAAQSLAGTGSKNLSIREGKWSTAQFQPLEELSELLHAETLLQGSPNQE